MDTSETYIKMCEKAEEIQAFKHSYTGEDVVLCDKYLNRDRPIVQTKGFLWLPRQDQLQEMAWTHTAGTYNLLPTKLFAFSDYWEEHGIPTMFTSMEQLWLAFVMKEKFGKIWSDGDWVNA